MGSDPTHSTLVSWQLNDNNRSAWDILWACASTIFACTWTVIHTDVPNRDASNFRQTLMFLRAWLMALLVPEVIFAFAWLQLMNARVSKNLYNIATTATTHEPAESRSYEIPIYKKFKKPLANSESEKWSLAQAFCIGAGGLALRTEDKWVYSVLKDKEMVALIESGILKPSDLPEQEIRSRAKADSFAKIFTLFQVLWFLCNAFTRWGYHLSVSPLELVTVAYVAIAILTYLSWWYKPKDISTPILVILSCDRETLEKDLLRDIDSNRWTHLQIQIKEESILNTITSVFEASIFVSDSISQDGEVVMKKNTDAFLSLISHFIYSFAALAYSGIHLAAWNFNFPTNTEKIAWKSFSLTTIGAVFFFVTVDFAMVAVDYLRESELLPSFMIKFYDQSSFEKAVKIQFIFKQISMYIYVLARLGIMALVCASMRNLPESSYTTVEWVASIPHF